MSKPTNALFLANIRGTYNVGAIARSAATFNVMTVFVGPATPYPAIVRDQRLPHIRNRATQKITKTSLGAEQHLTFTPIDNIDNALQQLKKHYFIIGLEQSPDAASLQNYSLKSDRPWLLVLGHETTGLSAATLSLCDVILEIRHSTLKNSLNVSVAASIAMFELTKKSQ